jgi:hypothetical protein
MYKTQVFPILLLFAAGDRIFDKQLNVPCFPHHPDDNIIVSPNQNGFMGIVTLTVYFETEINSN